MLMRRVFTTLLCCLVGVPAIAATVSPWQLPVTNDLVVRALATDEQDRLVVAGDDDGLVDGKPFDLVTRVLPDGTRDPSFEVSGLMPAGGVFSVAAGPDGSVYIAGFVYVPEHDGEVAIVRLAPSGARDAQWPGEALLPSGAVWQLSATPDGLLVFGSFESAGGQPRAGLARVQWDGSLDSGFVPDLDGPATKTAIAGDGSLVVQDQTGAIRRLSGSSGARLKTYVVPDGSFLGGAAGDAFYIAHGADLARYDVATGAPTAFAPPPSPIRMLFTSDWIYQVEAASADPFELVVRRYSSQTGVRDSGWSDQWLGDGQVNLLLQSAHGLVVAGTPLASDPHATALYRLRESDGAVDANFVPDVRRLATVSRLLRDGSGRVAVAGSFDRVGDVRRGGLARLLAAGLGLDAGWLFPFASTSPSDVELVGDSLLVSGQIPGSLSRVEWETGALAWWPYPAQSDGTVASPPLLVPAGDAVAVLRYGGTLCDSDVHAPVLVTLANPCTVVPLSEAPGDTIYAAEPSGTGIVWSRSPAPPAIGNFVERRIANGAQDPAWHVAFADGYVFLLLSSADGVYVAGTFTTIDGIPRAGLARLRHDGVLDATWKPTATGRPSALALALDGDLVVATDLGNGRSVLRRLRRIDAAVDTHLAAIVAGYVGAVVDVGAGFLVGGHFSAVAGQPRLSLALVSPDVLFDDSFD